MIKRAVLLLALTGSSLAYGASPVVYDANDVPLGIWIQNNAGEQVTMMTRTGYCVGILPRVGMFSFPECFFPIAYPGTLLFLADDCTGDAFVQTWVGNRGGFVVPLSEFGPLLYVPKDAVSQTRDVRSRRTEGTCEAFVASTMTFPMLPNDTGVTGIGIPLALPLEIRVEERCVFGDGFDCPAEGG